MRRARKGVVVRPQPLQLSGSLQGIGDRPDPLQVLALLAKRVIDLVHVLDHRTSLLPSPQQASQASVARSCGPSLSGVPGKTGPEARMSARPSALLAHSRMAR